jgi:hypothetical protein
MTHTDIYDQQQAEPEDANDLAQALARAHKHRCTTSGGRAGVDTWNRVIVHHAPTCTAR